MLFRRLPSVKTSIVVFFLLFHFVFISGSSAAISREQNNSHQNVSFHTFASAYDRGDYNKISELISSGFDVNFVDSNQRTPLAYAAAHGKDEVFFVRAAELLVKQGADVNTEDSFGRVPLIYAIEGERMMMVEYLLKNGADVTLQSRAYNMPIVFVPFMGQEPDLTYMVLTKCRDVNIHDSLGNTPLSWASRFGCLDSVKWLIKAGADINNRSIHGKTPLMEAAEKGHAEIAKLLVKEGANVDNQTKKGWSALMWASEKGYNEIVSVLIQAKADLFARNIRGERALTIAKMNNHPETVKIIEAAEFRYRLKQFVIMGALVILLAMFTVIVVRYVLAKRKLSKICH